MTPREAEARIGPVGALLSRLMFLALCLPGPVLLVAGTVQDKPADFWGLLAGGILITIVGVGFGLWGLRLVTRSRSDARQLTANGVAATAEILTAATHPGGEDSSLDLQIRVSGPGFVTFEAHTIRPEGPALVPGAVLPAVVDPADRLFTIG